MQRTMKKRLDGNLSHTEVVTQLVRSCCHFDQARRMPLGDVCRELRKVAASYKVSIAKAKESGVA